MAVKLRLTRLGKKKRPFYRIIAIDSRSPRDGRYLENLGHYNPLPDPFEVSINEERVLYWLGVGAIPSNTVKSLFRREGILFKWDLIKRGLSAEEMDQEMKRWEVIQLERKRKLERKAEAKAQEKIAEQPVPETEEEEAVEVEKQQDAPPAEETVEEVAAEVEEQKDAPLAEETVEEVAAEAEEQKDEQPAEEAGEEVAAEAEEQKDAPPAEETVEEVGAETEEQKDEQPVEEVVAETAAEKNEGGAQGEQETASEPADSDKPKSE